MSEKIEETPKKSGGEEIDHRKLGIKSSSSDHSQNFNISTSKVAKRFTSKQSMRQWKYDKRMSVRRKETIKARKYFKNHDDILNTHIPYGPMANKSPHIMVNHWFHRIKDNCILLRIKGENNNKKNRKIFYEIEKIGANVKLLRKKKYYNLNIDGTVNKKVILVVRYSDVMRNDKLSFFTETGKLIEHEKCTDKHEGYVILGTIQSEQSLRDLRRQFSANDLKLAKTHLRNQVVNSSKTYHFGTTGTIHGFGFGPVYKSNEVTNHSIEKFAKSESSLIFSCHNFVPLNINPF